jgi:hypothetical protein
LILYTKKKRKRKRKKEEDEKEKESRREYGLEEVLKTRYARM